jgi:hypothetical protein
MTTLIFSKGASNAVLIADGIHLVSRKWLSARKLLGCPQEIVVNIKY